MIPIGTIAIVGGVVFLTGPLLEALPASVSGVAVLPPVIPDRWYPGGVVKLKAGLPGTTGATFSAVHTSHRALMLARYGGHPADATVPNLRDHRELADLCDVYLAALPWDGLTAGALEYVPGDALANTSNVMWYSVLDVEGVRDAHVRGAHDPALVVAGAGETWKMLGDFCAAIDRESLLTAAQRASMGRDLYDKLGAIPGRALDALAGALSKGLGGAASKLGPFIALSIVAGVYIWVKR